MLMNTWQCMKPADGSILVPTKPLLLFSGSFRDTSYFSDQQSYQERIDSEARYLMKRSFGITGVGLVILLLIYLLARWLILTYNEILGFSYGVAVGLICAPLVIGVVSFLMRRLYKNRASFTKNQRN